LFSASAAGGDGMWNAVMYRGTNGNDLMELTYEQNGKNSGGR
jgi:hypothetical protein